MYIRNQYATGFTLDHQCIVWHTIIGIKSGNSKTNKYYTDLNVKYTPTCFYSIITYRNATRAEKQYTRNWNASTKQYPSQQHLHDAPHIWWHSGVQSVGRTEPNLKPKLKPTQKKTTKETHSSLAVFLLTHQQHSCRSNTHSIYHLCLIVSKSWRSCVLLLMNSSDSEMYVSRHVKVIYFMCRIH